MKSNVNVRQWRYPFPAILITILILSSVLTARAGEDGVEYSSVTYKTARLVIPKDFDTVMKALKASLAPYTAADAYRRYDAGATREDFIQSAKKSNPKRLPYLVYEIRWEVPVWIGTNERRQIYRLGIGGGPGRNLVGKYPSAGLHLVTDINLFAQEGATVVEVLLPSSKYAAAFPPEAGLAEAAQAADAKVLAFLRKLGN
ncbi:MAG: hypothetical protein ETSY1_18675 [Candidatus Entotheonella factor]|uniref:Uncharacterized protein n=1 Tax=Entotheonella factor TaxID=1429438 RepID=W4LK24_ENTF1|nr:MAG: hypothetical protein ETSY1_18675 [Candidatus Entotheonella factor]